MSFNHEAVAALPVGANADAAAIRAMCERRFAYTLAASEDAQNFVAVDPASGVVPLYLIQNSTLFAYDSTDSTTTHDGTTCLVSSDGKRFKSGVIQPPYSVLTQSQTGQPGNASGTTTFSTPSGPQDLSSSSFTLIDHNTSLNAGDVVTKLGVYNAAAATFVMKIVKRVSSTVYDVVVSQSFSHPGGGWADLTLSSAYTVPGTGYYVGAYVNSSAADLGTIPRTFKSGNITGSGVTSMTEDTGSTPGFRVVRTLAAPSVGDTYLIPTAATGTDWAGKDGKIGIYTAAGWRFAVQPIGRELYVRDEDAKYYRNSAGTWTAGVGSIPLAANSVRITNVLGAKASYVVKIENQITNAPPGSPVAPVAYIIGSSPTGAWAGNAGKLAVCLVTGTFTIITPDEGDQVYDKILNNNYIFSGTAWVSAAGAVLAEQSVFTAGTGSTSSGGTGDYTYSNTTAPAGQRGLTDLVVLTVTPHRSGAELSFFYQAFASVSNADNYVIALFRDSETNAIDWRLLPSPSTSVAIGMSFRVITADALGHDYKIKVMHSATDNGASALNRREFRVRELS